MIVGEICVPGKFPVESTTSPLAVSTISIARKCGGIVDEIYCSGIAVKEKIFEVQVAHIAYAQCVLGLENTHGAAQIPDSPAVTDNVPAVQPDRFCNRIFCHIYDFVICIRIKGNVRIFVVIIMVAQLLSSDHDVIMYGLSCVPFPCIKFPSLSYKNKRLEISQSA